MLNTYVYGKCLNYQCVDTQFGASLFTNLLSVVNANFDEQYYKQIINNIVMENDIVYFIISNAYTMF